ncbi:MAG: gliding motility-associated C-terminal domain-containing protein [Caldilineae bacterium]|nr:MAG: gliding motility-associated C-terminal domain-containing protein [Caldilineae bacterium]
MTGGTTGDTLWWSTGEGEDTLLVMASGAYTLYGATEEGCVGDTTVEVSVPAPLAVWWMVEDEVCAGSGDGAVWVTDYSGGVPPVHFWLDGQMSPSGEWTGVGAGWHELRAADSLGCVWTEWIEVGRGDSVLVVAAPDTSIFSGEVVGLWVWSDPPADSVQWTPAQWLDCAVCSEVTAMPGSSTTWTVQVWDERGCSGSDTVRVEVVEWREAVVAPNVFSPNGDGVNDYFGLYGTVEGEVLRLEVYDRWGELVYAGRGLRLNEPGTGWDGRHRGKPAATDVYVWQALVRLGDGRVVRLHGDVTLLR